VRRQPIAGSAGIAADPALPGPPVDDDGRRDERPVAAPSRDQSGLTRARHVLGNPASWRVRTKLIAILAVPVLAILVNSSIQASAVLSSTRDVNRVRDLTEISRAATKLAFALERERTYTVVYVTQGSLANRKPRSLETITSLRAATDEAYQAYQNATAGRRGSFGTRVRAGLDEVSSQMSRLGGKRKTVESLVDPGDAQEAYRSIIDSLLGLVPLIPQGNDDAELNAGVGATDHLARATELLAEQQTLVASLLVKGTEGRFTSEDYRTFLGAVTERENELNKFDQVATPAQGAVYHSRVDVKLNNDVDNTAKYTDVVLSTSIGQPLTEEELALPKWLQATKTTIDLSAESSGKLLDMVDQRVGQLRSNIQRGALLSGLLIVIILAFALLAAMVVARSLVRPLLALRTAALDIAGRRLPEAVRRLRDSSEQAIDDSVEPVGIETDEEIGEVARAFDAVHREAVRLASEQAVLRNNVNAMFVNLSRRSQGLVERQLRLIDDLENREQDPDQLSNLFKLDHLATRMRRNNESLLVLAGTDTARRWTHPVPLNEVVLAAISEVEQYTRVKQTTAAPVSIAGNGVSDVVHLIAELLENATSYSPPVTDVLISSHSLGPGAGGMIEIEDQGIGMPAKDLERINERLANPPVIDVSVSRTMGLFAVGRLASRHGIRVQLRESASGGITAVVRLPAKLVAGEGAPAPNRGTQLPGPAARAGIDPGRSGGAFGARVPELNGSGNPAALEPPRHSGPMSFGDTGPVPRLGNGTFGGGHGLNGRHTTERHQPPPGEIGVGEETTEFGGYPPATGPLPIEGGTGPRPVYRADQGTSGRGAASSYADPPTSDLGLESFDPGGDDRHGGDMPGDGTPGDGLRTGAENPPTGPVFVDPTPTPPPDLGRARFGGARMREMPGHQAPGTGPERIADPPTGPRTGPLPPAGQGAGRADPDATPAPADVFARPAHRPSFEGSDEPAGSPPHRAERGSDPLDDPSFGRTEGRTEDSGERSRDRDSDDLDTTPIFDSVSAWFQRRTPGIPVEPRRAPSTRSFSPPRAGARPTPTGSAGAARQPPAPSQRNAHVSDDYSAGPSHGGPVHPVGPRPPAPGVPSGDQPVPAGSPAPVPTGAVQSSPSAGRQVPAASAPEPSSWSSPADAGWRAAESVRQPTAGGVTRSGLPMRVPMTHLVPGSAEAAPRQRPSDAATRSPEAVGGRLASFYQGVRQGREVGSDNPRGPRRDAQEER
jgi:signal transduction histidine kinase